MEKRKMNLIIGKYVPGKTPSPKISLPKTWIEKMGCDSEDKEVSICFNEEKKEIIIRKEENKMEELNIMIEETNNERVKYAVLVSDQKGYDEGNSDVIRYGTIQKSDLENFDTIEEYFEKVLEQKVNIII